MERPQASVVAPISLIFSTRGEWHEQTSLARRGCGRCAVRWRRRRAAVPDTGSRRGQGGSEVPELELRAALAEEGSAEIAGGAAGDRNVEERSGDAHRIRQSRGR